jgi:transcription elongation factor Elf1
MDQTDTQQRVIFTQDVTCPYCAANNRLEFTTEDDEQMQLFACDDCGLHFTVFASFTLQVDVYSIKPVPKRRQKRSQP